MRDGFVFAFVIELMQSCISIHYYYSSVVRSFVCLLNLPRVLTTQSVEGFSRLMLSNSPSLSTKMTNHPLTYNCVISTSASNKIAISRNSLSVLASGKFLGCIATLLIFPMSTSTGLLAVVYMSLHPTSRSQNHPLLARALSLGATTSIR